MYVYIFFRIVVVRKFEAFRQIAGSRSAQVSLRGDAGTTRRRTAGLVHQ